MSIPVISYSCPLSSKISTGHNSLTSKCHKIIESARHIWGYYSPEYQSLCYEYDTNGKEVPKKFPPYSTLKLTLSRIVWLFLITLKSVTVSILSGMVLILN